MIPWASFTGPEACYTDLQFRLRETILLSHAGPPLDLKQEFEQGSMLANASERRFALSQLDHSHYDQAAEHVEAIRDTLTQLSIFFDKHGLFMPSPHLPSSPYKEDLLGLTIPPVDEFEIPEFHLDGSDMTLCEAVPSTTMPLSITQRKTLRPVFKASNRLSISSLVNPEPTTGPTATCVLAHTPITVDSAPSPFALDDSQLHSGQGQHSDFEAYPGSMDLNTLFKTSDEQLLSSLDHLVRSRRLYSTAIPLSHPSRMHKQQRMRRSSRSRPDARHSQSEEIRKAMLAEDESRRRDMEKINETWRVMKQKEEEEEEKRMKVEESALAGLQAHMIDRENEEEVRAEEEGRSHVRKRIKLDHACGRQQLDHVMGAFSSHDSAIEEEGIATRRASEAFDKYDRGLS